MPRRRRGFAEGGMAAGAVGYVESAILAMTTHTYSSLFLSKDLAAADLAVLSKLPPPK